MIRVLVELWPFGDESRRRPIGEMKIWNDGTGTKKTGNYKFVWWRRAKTTRNQRCKPHQGEVRSFPRLSKNVFELIRLCLNAPEKKVVCECGNTDLLDGVCHKTHMLPRPPAPKPRMIAEGDTSPNPLKNPGK